MENHTLKRRRKDPGCFEKLLKIPVLEPDDLRAKSQRVVASPCLIYQAMEKAKKELRMYFVDADMVLAATNKTRTSFITCYHIHPLSNRCPGKPSEEQLINALIDHRRKLLRQNIPGLKFLSPQT